MTWRYEQSTGRLSGNGTLLATGYSGHGLGKNDPDRQSERQIGPIPRGLYFIGWAEDTATHGPSVLRLYPVPASMLGPGNEMHGRDGFLIHGDSRVAPGTASTGCIIVPLQPRLALNRSKDRWLEVVR